MKRNNQGYVLALVLVVTLILCSIASIIATSATNNIKTDVISFYNEKTQYELEGLAQQYFAQLQQLEGKVSDSISTTSEGHELKEYVLSQINGVSTFSDWYLTLDADNSSVDGDGTVTNQFFSSDGKKKYRFIIKPATEQDGNAENEATFRISTELYAGNSSDPDLRFDIEISTSGAEEPEDSGQYTVTFGPVRFIDPKV